MIADSLGDLSRVHIVKTEQTSPILKTKFVSVKVIWSRYAAFQAARLIAVLSLDRMCSSIAVRPAVLGHVYDALAFE